MTARQAPPPGSLVRDSNTGSIWQSDDAVRWIGRAPNGRVVEVMWEELATRWGELEMLVPVRWDHTTPDGNGADLAQQLAENVLNPVGAMMLQLGQAAGAAITSCVSHAYRLGQQHPSEYAAMVAAMRATRDDDTAGKQP